MKLSPDTRQAIPFDQLYDPAHEKDIKRLQNRLISIDHTLKNVWKPPTAAMKRKLEAEREKIINQLHEINVIPPEVEKQFELLAKRCKNYIQGAQQAGGWLYRGYGPESSALTMDSFVAATWSGKQRRDPRDSDKRLSLIYDQVMKKQGFKALRLTSIFTTGDKQHAGYYGEGDHNIYVILPVDGKSNMLWTAKRDIELYGIEDVMMKGNLDMYVDEILVALNQAKHKNQITSAQATLWNIALLKFPVSYEFDLTEFNKLVTMVQKQFAQGNPLELPDYIADMKKPVDFVNVAKFMEHYQPRTGNWAEAIASKHEVCITGAYYAFRSSIFEQWLNTYFGIKK